MTTAGEPRLGPVLGWMAAFVVLGAFPFYLVWSFLNELLAGGFEARSAGLALLGFLVLAALLRVVVRRIRRWEGVKNPSSGRDAA